MAVAEPRKILILGTGGNSVDILDTIFDINDRSDHPQYECLGFLDDSSERWGQQIAGATVLGPLSSAGEYQDAFFVNGIGSERNFWKKERIIAATGIPDERFATIVHPTASVSRMSRLGPGTVVLQQVTIASNVTIGKHVIILPNTVISHDDVIGDFTAIAGGVCVSGIVQVGRSCYLGTNSSIISQVTIGNNSLVGMGSVVQRDVAENSVVVGNPARFLRHTDASLTPPASSADERQPAPSEPN